VCELRRLVQLQPRLGGGGVIETHEGRAQACEQVTDLAVRKLEWIQGSF